MSSDAREVQRVLLAQVGDREAFDALLREIQVPLFRYLTRLTGRAEEAEDLVQDVFLLLYRRLRSLREPELFRPWMYRIATRAALRRVSKRSREAERLEEYQQHFDREAATPQPPPDREWIEGLLNVLSPNCRTVIVLHFLEELPLQNVAAVLGIPLGTVKSRLAYALHTLRTGPAPEGKQS
ncbi:MAG: RNA polymerase sigma factor [Planctomycetes bacterium]|nr:RNA polymerase sigma factor [Planctomycetota bacterium]